MAYLQELIQSQNQQIAIQEQNNRRLLGLNNREAYAQYFPSWEVTAPQYQTPIAWSLEEFFRTNEVVYACIDLWMKTIGEPSLKVYNKKTDKEVVIDEFYRFMEQPCPDISETDFWSANMMYLKLAGGMPWEKDFANDGSLLHVWPMMPQYCSYMRGQGKLLRAIRYQPYTGLPYDDIPRDKVLLFMYPDPKYFGLKPLSPTAVLAGVVDVDNNMTTMIETFLKNGAFVSGILSTEQLIDEADARFARERFRESHGGPNKAGDVVVVGKGMSFERMNNNNREFMFPEVDARNEVRICMGYGVKPILVSAKVGMDRSTYNNYKEARQAWYEENVTSEWKFLAERVTRDILLHFTDDENLVCRFDTKNVKALQEDRTAMWDRAGKAYKDRIIPRNGALVEMGLNPLPDSDPMALEYYTTVLSQSSTTDDLDIDNNSQTPEEGGKVKKPAPTQEEKDEEEKKFRAFAKRRIKENKRADIPEYEFLHLDEKRQRQLLNEYDVPDPDAEMVLKGLLAVLDTQRDNRMVQPINITANIEPGKPADVHVTNQNNLPEQKTRTLPPVVNVTNVVEPTPVEIKNDVTVNTPKVKREKQTIRRDASNNIEGTVTDIEYEGGE